MFPKLLQSEKVCVTIAMYDYIEAVVIWISKKAMFSL